ncbi:phosphopentomutase [Streptomyces sp. NPDC059740]|uniref:phosphopentomutase n=1 Tax=Streptomyces sp. NPDC059740 TaxID=3346926 RepID=UPI0036696E1C
MSRTVILVIDGFGIGAMPDAGRLRPGDARADTLGRLLDHHRARTGRALPLPGLAALGIGAVHPHPDLPRTPSLPVTAGRAGLGYPGADTYAGHQTMMGADFSHVTVARLAEHAGEVAAALRAAGRRVERWEGRPLLVVDGHTLVHDNLEADPGINWNASGRLEETTFEQVLAIASTVREVAPVARVIAVAGHSAQPLPCHVREGDGGTLGLDTPASGFYRNGGLEVRHLGAPLDHTRQLPDLAARAGAAVTLVGKAADLLACAAAVRRPAVATAEVLAHTAEAVQATGDRPALVVANVQETDLAGHQQDADRYVEVLRRVDAGLEHLAGLLTSPGDRLIVTGDHGNDPLIGHGYHTREFVPVLVSHPGRAAAGAPVPDAASLADVGATAAVGLGLDPAALGNGRPLPLGPLSGASSRR